MRASSLSAAHLKLRNQRLMAGAFDLNSASSSQLIAIYRSEISPPLANSLFFSKASNVKKENGDD